MFFWLVIPLQANTGRLKTLGVLTGVKAVLSDLLLVTLAVSATWLLSPMLDF